MLGVLTCPGIFPTIFTILWKRQSRAAAIISPLLGMVTGLAVWLGSAYALEGSVSIAATGGVYPCAYGTAASAFSPLPYSIIITYLFGSQDFDWADFKRERLGFESSNQSINDVSGAASEHGSPSGVFETEQGAQTTADNSEKPVPIIHHDALDIENPHHPDHQRFLSRWAKIAAFWSAATFLGHWVLWPLPMVSE